MSREGKTEAKNGKDMAEFSGSKAIPALAPGRRFHNRDWLPSLDFRAAGNHSPEHQKVFSTMCTWVLGL